MKDITNILDKTKRNLTKVFQHQISKLEELQMTQEAIHKI